VFYCPFCHHYKYKFVVNLDEKNPKFQHYHCWVCGVKGASLTILFKKLGASTYLLNQIYSILNITNIPKIYSKNELYQRLDTSQEEITELIYLPQNYTPITQLSTNSIEFKKIKTIFKSRNIRSIDILRYDIGFCEQGPFSNNIIIPSYNEYGSLNFYIGYHIYTNKYRKAAVSNNCIIFEHLISWNQPIILCEGIFDAFAIRINSIPLLGKFISPLLKAKLIYYKPPVYIALDGDAQLAAEQLSRELFKEGISCYIVELNKSEDPDSIGYSEIWKKIEISKPYTESNELLNKLFQK